MVLKNAAAELLGLAAVNLCREAVQAGGGGGDGGGGGEELWWLGMGWRSYVAWDVLGWLDSVWIFFHFA